MQELEDIVTQLTKDVIRGANRCKEALLHSTKVYTQCYGTVKSLDHLLCGRERIVQVHFTISKQPLNHVN